MYTGPLCISLPPFIQVESTKDIVDVVIDAEALKFQSARPLDVFYVALFDFRLFLHAKDLLWQRGYDSFVIFQDICVPIFGTYYESLFLSFALSHMHIFSHVHTGPVCVSQASGGSHTMRCYSPNM